MFKTILLENWEGLVRIAISAPLVYIAVILFVRLTGKRATSQLNNFDWIVTVAMGSMVGSAIILKNVPVLDALTGIGMLLLLQFAITKLTTYSSLVSKLTRAQPTLLFFKGEFLQDRMRSQRIMSEEVLGAIREHGISRLEDVEAVVLETDASFSVLPKQKHSSRQVLEQVAGFPE